MPLIGNDPKRIQRQRTKGWRMPEGAIYVGRPTIWGNPFWHAARFHGVELSLALYRNTVQGIWNPSVVAAIPITYYDEHFEWLLRMRDHPLEVMRRELRGKTLCCWCAPEDKCHADILLELANADR